MFQQNSRRDEGYIFRIRRRNPLSAKETTSGTACVCNVRNVPSSGAARVNTCELKVARGRRIHVYASRTLIQDCASRSREVRLRQGGEGGRGDSVAMGFPQEVGTIGSLPRIPPSRAEEVEAGPSAAPPPLRGSIQRQTLVGTLA